MFVINPLRDVCDEQRQQMPGIDMIWFDMAITVDVMSNGC
jgi:hypothetical protein